MLDLDDIPSLTVNGTSLAVHRNGQGTPVVLVHGGVSDLRTWENQIGPFGRRHHTIAYSRRYHRPNAAIHPDAPDPIEMHVDDLAELLGATDLSTAHVIGHSWGGLIALILAMRRPELLRSLVLIEPPIVSLHVNIPPRLGQMLRLLIRSPRLAVAIARLGGGALAPAEKAFGRGDDRAAIERFGRGVLGRRRYSMLSLQRYAQVWDNRGPDRAQALYKGFPDLIGACFDKVSMPVLLVAGTESPDLFRLLIDDLAGRLADATTVVLPDASHIVHEDAPERFNEAVLRFLDRVDQTTA